MRQTRRQFVRSGAAVATGTAVLAGTAAASHLEDIPENVSIEFDQVMLEKYRPRLVFPTEAREKLIGLYGWVAKSPDYSTDVCCFWSKYTHQEGWLGDLDSHWGDHEPLQVVVDSETGDVVRVRASIYHWIKGEVVGDAIPMHDETHPRLRVLSPHHQYTAPRPADSGSFFEVDDLTGAFGDWLSNGLEVALRPGSTTNPWIMQNHGHWWRNTETALGIELPFSHRSWLVKSAAAAGYDTVGSLEGTSA